MTLLLLVYLIYLILYGLVSYAILFHLIRYRIEGDRSGTVLALYIILSIVVIAGSFLFLLPV